MLDWMRRILPQSGPTPTVTSLQLTAVGPGTNPGDGLGEPFGSDDGELEGIVSRPGDRFLLDSVVRELTGDNGRIHLDLSSQVLRLSIPSETERHRWGKRGGDWNAGERQPEGALAPTAPLAPFVSAAMLAVHAKLFDDGLYAAAELAAQPRRARLLAGLSRCGPRLGSAVLLGTGMREAPEGNALLRAFFDDPLKSTPLGFYTWSPELEAIFRQGRALQDPLEADEATRVRAALRADPAVSAEYDWSLALLSRLTNPFITQDLREPSGTVLFPASRSHESDLVKRLFGQYRIPEAWSPMDAMLHAIQSGSLDAAPAAESGWYDHQTWALAALARLEHEPEGARLDLDQTYRAHLDELFKGVLAATRETHVKQLRITPGASPSRRRHPVFISPSLSVEPLPSYFERKALGYGFVRDVLEEAGLLRSMRRATPTGPAGRPLDDELAEITALFHAAAAVARQELGQKPATDADRRRLAGIGRSDTLLGDVRMMVPVLHDPQQRTVRVWALLGWTSRDLKVSWHQQPGTTVRGWVRVQSSDSTYPLATPVFAEISVPRLLNRDEFRAVCDKHRTREAILTALRAG